MMKVFKINDYDWYMASSLEEAISLAMVATGLSREEAVDDPYEESEESMNKLMFVNDDGSKWPFAVELSNRIQAGMKPGVFASTEF